MQSPLSPAKANKALFFFGIYFLGISAVLGIVLAILGAEENMMLYTGIAQIAGLFVPFVFYLIITKQSPKKVLPWKGLSLKNTLLVVVISLAILPIIQIVAFLSSFIFTPVIMDVDFTASPMWITLIVTAVFPALFEEFWFRGALYTGYRAGGVSILKTALITALFFGLTHSNLHQALFAFLIGILYAYMVYYTGSILAPILGHFINNGIHAVLAYVEPYVQWADSMAEAPGTFLLIMAVSSLVMIPVVWLCMKQFKKHYAANCEEAAENEEDLQVAETDELAAKPKVYTWGFWAALSVFAFVALLVEFALRMAPVMMEFLEQLEQMQL